MSNVVSNVKAFLETNQNWLKFGVILVVIGVVVYFMKCSYFKENLYMDDYQEYVAGSKDDRLPLGKKGMEVDGAKKKSDLEYGSAPITKGKMEINPEDLLPKTDLNGVFKEDTDILMGNFVTPGVTYGIDTVGSSLKKANYSIRSMPQIPVNRDVSPWGLSSYEPDLYRKPLE